MYSRSRMGYGPGRSARKSWFQALACSAVGEFVISLLANERGGLQKDKCAPSADPHSRRAGSCPLA